MCSFLKQHSFRLSPWSVFCLKKGTEQFCPMLCSHSLWTELDKETCVSYWFLNRSFCRLTKISFRFVSVDHRGNQFLCIDLLWFFNLTLGRLWVNTTVYITHVQVPLYEGRFTAVVIEHRAQLCPSMTENQPNGHVMSVQCWWLSCFHKTILVLRHKIQMCLSFFSLQSHVVLRACRVSWRAALRGVWWDTLRTSTTSPSTSTKTIR